MNARDLDAVAERIFAGAGRSAPLAEGREAEAATFTETFRPEAGALAEARVSREDARLADVALLGRVSKNGRIYTDEALKDAARLYDRAHLYLDHPTSKELRAREGVRSVRDLIGRAENTRVVGDRVRGDAVLLETPHRDLVLSLAEQAPELAGFSHRASGQVRVREDGTQVVESLNEVFAVELVTEPATVRGLQEQIGRRGGAGGGGRRPVTDRVVEEAYSSLFV